MLIHTFPPSPTRDVKTSLSLGHVRSRHVETVHMFAHLGNVHIYLHILLNVRISPIDQSVLVCLLSLTGFKISQFIKIYNNNLKTAELERTLWII